MTINNHELIGLLADSLTGVGVGIGPLLDAMRDAGHSKAADKLLSLLALADDVRDDLADAEADLSALSSKFDKWGPQNIDDLESLSYDNGYIDACKTILKRMGEQ